MLHVVAGAVVVAERVLAARRADTGGWEFPGGKVEAGESPEQALVRELQEELALPVTIGPRLGEALDDRIRIVLFAARPGGDPVLGPDHDALRWLSADELSSVDWLPIDAALLPAVRALLQGGVQP